MVAIYTLTSELHDEKAVGAVTKEFLGSLDIEYVFRGNDYSDYGSYGLSLIYVCTGGTEGIFKKLLPDLQAKSISPFYLLTSGRSNSLAASMEILSYLRQNNMKGEIIHGSAVYITKRIKLLSQVEDARNTLLGSRLGIIGQPSGLAKASVSKIVIERTLKLVTITICTARPGIVIGKGGQDVDKLKEELKKLYDKEIQINIFEVKRPELDATIVANNIARQVEGKIAYRRAIKMAIQNTMRAGAEGIKVLISGRLNGAEIARSEMLKEGRTPLHTFRADIDYCHAEALTKVGILGIKVWICRGEIYGDVDLAPNFAQEKSSGRSNGGNRGGDRKFRNKKK